MRLRRAPFFPPQDALTTGDPFMILVPAFDYTVEFENEAITVANGNMDLFSIDVPSDRIVVVTAMELMAIGITGDANEDTLRLQAQRGYTTAASGGNAETAQAVNDEAPNAVATYRSVDETVATTGTIENLWSGGFNVRVPYFVEFYRPFVIKQTDNIWVMRLMAAVAADLNLSGTLYVSEI